MIGTFDGVHAGHAALVRRARERVGPGGRVVALSFDPHPVSVLRPGREPALLTDFATRAGLLRALGVDGVERLVPTPDLLDMTPGAFVAWVVERHRPVVFVEGEGFRFGRGRSGTLDDLAAMGAGMGFAVEVVGGSGGAGGVCAMMSDGSLVRVSSSLVRWLLRHGRVEDAASALGRRHRVEGVVTPGDRRGRTVGFPTANVSGIGTLVPGDGVYACVAEMPDGRRYASAVNIGARPTVGGHERRVEAHLLLDGDRLWPGGDGPEYGWRVSLEFAGWVREEMRFGSVGALVEQIGRDVARARGIVGGEASPGVTPRAEAFV
ncbi:MAG: bifunctional riboflavin kinase/FAD synthetase [Phycisphaeraceae bacterium]|nr:MAG: bifunctional riboflavin kinase/FAD synthetase [Phycisphaeraceae bacterium]